MSKEMFDLMESNGLDGFSRVNKQHAASVASAVALWGDLIKGRVPSYFLQEALQPRTPAVAYTIEKNYPGLFRMQEAMSRSDFPLLTGDVLDRMALARYREFPSAWRTFTKVVNGLRDFRSVRRVAADGLEGQWSSLEELREVPYDALSETGYSYAPLKYGKAARISFEALKNDDLDQFTSIPDRLGRGGARTVSKFATGLYIGTTGPHASLYSVGNGNIITGNPALSIASLQTGWTLLRTMKDADGEPIMVESAVLVVPPSLEVIARNILNAVTVRATASGGASGMEIEFANWVGSALKLAVDPYISVIATTNGNTTWALFADPAVGRPALEVGFLAGFNEPQLYQKVSDTIRVGGGVDQMAGDFTTMSQDYKGVVAFGGTRLDPKSTVASNGSGV